MDGKPGGRSVFAAVAAAATVVALCLGCSAGEPRPRASSDYDSAVLRDQPVAFLPLASGGRQAADASGHGHDGVVLGSPLSTTPAPNGDPVATFTGVGSYVEVPPSAQFSVTTTGWLTWEAWIKPAALGLGDPSRGYVDWMGVCAHYAPSCEWGARMYAATNPQGRCSRMSAYVFNPGAGLGSAADWQPTCGSLETTAWLHIVAEFQTWVTPEACDGAFPGDVNIWVDGVPWDAPAHRPTGCLSQYRVRPQRGSSPLTIGTMARDSWFVGAIGKVAVYDRLLTLEQITAHYTAMTGRAPSGDCGVTCRP